MCCRKTSLSTHQHGESMISQPTMSSCMSCVQKKVSNLVSSAVTWNSCDGKPFRRSNASGSGGRAWNTNDTLLVASFWTTSLLSWIPEESGAEKRRETSGLDHDAAADVSLTRQPCSHPSCFTMTARNYPVLLPPIWDLTLWETVDDVVIAWFWTGRTCYRVKKRYLNRLSLVNNIFFCQDLSWHCLRVPPKILRGLALLCFVKSLKHVDIIPETCWALWESHQKDKKP